MWSWGWSWFPWNATAGRSCLRDGRGGRTDQGSGPEHAGVESRLFIAEDLVGGAPGAGRLRPPVAKLGGERPDVAVQVSEDLLAVRVADGDGPHPGADHPEGRLVEI